MSSFVIMDFVMIDEFYEPFFFKSKAELLKNDRLFDNSLNIDLSGAKETQEQIISIKS